MNESEDDSDEPLDLHFKLVEHELEDDSYRASSTSSTDLRACDAGHTARALLGAQAWQALYQDAGGIASELLHSYKSSSRLYRE